MAADGSKDDWDQVRTSLLSALEKLLETIIKCQRVGAVLAPNNEAQACRTVEMLVKVADQCPSLIVGFPETFIRVLVVTATLLAKPAALGVHKTIHQFVQHCALALLVLDDQALSCLEFLDEFADIAEECDKLTGIPKERYPVAIALFQGLQHQYSLSPVAKLEIDTLLEAKTLASNLRNLLGQCARTLQHDCPWLSCERYRLLRSNELDDGRDGQFHPPFSDCYNLERILLSRCLSEKSVAVILDDYIHEISEGAHFRDEKLAAIVRTCSACHPWAIRDLFVLAFRATTCPLTSISYSWGDDSPSTTNAAMCILQVTTSFASCVLLDASEALFIRIVGALIESRTLQNVIPTISFLLARLDPASALEFIFSICPFISKSASRLVLGYLLKWLSQLNALPPSEEMDREVSEFSIVVPEISAELKGQVFGCIAQFPTAHLPEGFPQRNATLEVAERNDDSRFRQQMNWMLSNLGPSTLTQLVLLIQQSGQDPRRALFPYWEAIIERLAGHDSSFQIAALETLSGAMSMSRSTLLSHLRRFLIPRAIFSRSLQKTLFLLTGIEFEKFLIDAIEDWILWVIMKHEDGWESHIAGVQDRFPILKGKSPNELVVAAGINLVIQLCLNRHEKGIQWVQNCSKDKRIQLLDISLASLIELNDSLVHDRWSPQRQSPKSALQTLEWLMRTVRADIGMMAPQIIALLTTVASEFPDLVIDCWTTLIDGVGEETLCRFWSAILMWSCRCPEVCASPKMEAFLAFMFQRVTPELLQECPDLHSNDLIFEPYKQQIRSAKRAYDADTNLRKVFGHIESADLAVAEASLRDLRDIITRHENFTLQAHEYFLAVRALSKVAEHHPQLANLSGECIGEIGLHDFTHFAPAANFLEAPRGSVVFFDVKSLCANLMQTCLIPHFRSSTSGVLQTLIAFSIQELFKLYKQDLQSALDEYDLSTVRHLVSSKYRVNFTSDRSTLECRSALPEVLYTPDRDVTSWACDLTMILGDRCLDPELSKVLAALHPLLVTGRLHQAARGILPYLVLNLCYSSDEAILFLVREFVHVLDYAPDHKQAHQCCNLIFDILNYLNAWKRHDNVRNRDRRVRRAADGAPDPVQRLVSQVPARSLAAAAEAIGLYETAVFHLDSAPFQSSQQLLHIYMHQGLEDYVVGAAKLFESPSGPPALTDADLPSEVTQSMVVRFAQLPIDYVALQHAVTGDWASVQSVYESALYTDSSQFSHHAGLYRAMRELGYFEGLLDQCNGVVGRYPKWAHGLDAFRIEACWKLSEWDLLEEIMLARSKLGQVDVPSNPRPDQQASHQGKGAFARLQTNQALEPLGQVFYDLSHGRTNDFLAHMGSMHAQVIQRFRILGSHDGLVPCHILSDIHRAAENLLDMLPASKSFNREEPVEAETNNWTKNLSTWYNKCKARLVKTPQRYDIREDIISACRAMLSIYARAARGISFRDLAEAPGSSTETVWRGCMGELWLLTASLAMKDGRQHTAYTCLRRASAFMKGDGSAIQSLRLDYAFHHCKWLIRNASKREALSKLMSLKIPNIELSELETLEARWKIEIDWTIPAAKFSKLQLLEARLMDETEYSNSDAIIAKLHSACAMLPDWEKAHYRTGRYYHKLMASNIHAPKRLTSPLSKDYFSIVESAVKCFGRALLVGCKYSRQALPQVLTLWIDLATESGNRELAVETLNRRMDKSGTRGHERERVFDAVTQRVRGLIRTLPPYVLMIAIAQVTSRICHHHDTVCTLLSEYLRIVLKAYPSQCLWHLAASFKSAERVREARTIRILESTIAEDGAFETAAKQGFRLWAALLQLSNLTATKEQTSMLISKSANELHRLCPSSNIVLPTEIQLQSTLPADGALRFKSEFDPFVSPTPAGGQGTRVTLHGFQDKVELMSSLVRPKKLTVIGSDGREYVFLVKPKDDLRKDARLMEVVGLINHLLERDRVARERHLQIRGYAVTPLNEECGLIEWVPHTTALRSVLRTTYKQRYKMDLYNRDVHTLFAAPRNQLLGNFHKLLSQYPPVLQEWFIEAFPSPQEWFAARLRFTRSSAVMSMVGYILGLGDRHLENLLLDVTVGDTVHVDFNCLFDKGKTFAKPEIVPFRLTQNMVAVYGAVGIEGPFRRACEITMALLRGHREELMIVLNTFLHDPLIEWKAKRKRNMENSEEQMRATATKLLADIEDRLCGIVAAGMSLGVDGQVEELIRQAVAPEKLALMYEGWMPYL